MNLWRVPQPEDYDNEMDYRVDLEKFEYLMAIYEAEEIND